METGKDTIEKIESLVKDSYLVTIGDTTYTARD